MTCADAQHNTSGKHALHRTDQQDTANSSSNTHNKRARHAPQQQKQQNNATPQQSASYAASGSALRLRFKDVDIDWVQVADPAFARSTPPAVLDIRYALSEH